MSKVHMLRALVEQRLTLAAEEIFELFERTMGEYEEELCRQQKLLSAVFQPEVRLHRADVQQLMVNREAVPPEQQIWRPRLEQQNPPELPNIKEEQGELWTKQEEEQLQLLEEADITKFTFTPVKSADEEEKPQTSQLHQSQTEELRDAEHLKSDADEEHSGRSEAARNLNPDNHLETAAHDETSHFSESENDDIYDWEEMVDSESGLKPLQNNEVLLSDKEINTGEASVSSSERAADFGHKGRLQKQKLNNAQTRVSSFSCSVCGKGFRSKGSLRSHMRLHSATKRYSCSVCRKTFDRRHNLLTHQRIHTGDKPFSCPFCGKNFTQSSALTSHLRIHTGEKPFKCSKCEACFTVGSNLARHIKLHHGDKPFSRSFSGKTFGKKESLDFEMSCHTGDKPFQCSVCRSGFTDSESLVKHMRIHTRQTQFSCSVCGEEFAWRRYLTKHMEVHAKEKFFRCRVCDGRFTQIYELRNHQCYGESSEFYESQAEENREAELLTGSSNEQMEMEADGEDTKGPGSVRNLDPERLLKPDADDSADSDFWQENREPGSGFDSQEHNKVSQSDTTCNADRKQLDCSDKKPYEKSMEVHAGQHRGAERNPEPPHIKEEQEELWSSQGGEQLHQLEEADIFKFTFTPVPVKSEDDDEEKPQTSQLQTQTEQIKTEADGEDCGGPEPARNSDPEGHFQPDGDDSVDSDFWKETRERSTGPSSLKNDETPEGSMGLNSGNEVFGCSEDKAPESPGPDSDDSDFGKDNRKPQQTHRNVYGCRKPYTCSECNKRFQSIHHLKSHKKFHLRERTPLSCSVCGQGFLYKFPLKIHMRTHTGEKPFPCPVCGKKYAHKASMQSHMVIHSKQYACNACHRSFAWYTELKYHQCVGESSHETPDEGKNV